MKRQISVEKTQCCEEDSPHLEVVKKVRESMPEEETLYDVSELFKVFGDGTRIKILMALLESEMCVCDIGALLGMTKSAISHQLRVLRQAKLVKFRKAGKEVFYSLDDEHVGKILSIALDHINE